MGKGRYPIAGRMDRRTGEITLLYREDGPDEDFAGTVRPLLHMGEAIAQWEEQHKALERLQLLQGHSESTEEDSPV